MENSPVILITGASSGIGEATARQFARLGYRVALAARRIGRLEAISAEIQAAGGQALAVATDVTKIADLERIMQATLKRFGRLDVLFNNAGFGRLDWLETLDPVEDIEAQIQVNLLGVIQATRLALPEMIAQRRGHIINMASIAGLIGTPTYSIYAASKFAIRGFSEALRREVGVYGIRVSVIYPGGVATEFKTHTRARRKTGLTTPNRLRLSSEQVAEAVWQVVQHPRRNVILPPIYRLGVLVNALSPGIVDWVIEKRFTAIERNQKEA